MMNTLIVFFLSGLWHGANWNYVCWGVLNGSFIACEDIFGKGIAKNRLLRNIKMIPKWMNTVITFILVDFTWIFFRAKGTKEAIAILKSMTHLDNFNVFYDNTIHFYLMEKHSFFMMLISVLLLIIVDICHNKGIHFRKLIAGRNIIVQWTCYLCLIMAVLIFGVWGPSFDETAFIYFQF